MTARKNVKKPETMAQLTEALLTAVGLCYPNDPSRAGVVLSRLQNGTYYASLCRYLKAYGGDKQVLCKATGPDAESAVRALATSWRGAPRDAAYALRALDAMLIR